MKHLKILAPIMALALALALAACVAEPEADPLELVPELAQSRWDHLVERRFGEAWHYYTPGFRETMDERDFTYDMNRRPVRWRAATVREIECEGDRCVVTTDLTYNVPSAPSGMSRIENTRPVEETWIRVDGKWWFLPET